MFVGFSNFRFGENQRYRNFEGACILQQWLALLETGLAKVPKGFRNMLGWIERPQRVRGRICWIMPVKKSTLAKSEKSMI